MTDLVICLPLVLPLLAPAAASWLLAGSAPALAVTGESPTVLAFVLGGGPGRVIYEVLNQPESATFVYRAEGGLAAVNRALDDAGFRPDPAADQVPHDTRWAARIAELLGN